MKHDVVIPARNEQGTVAQIVEAFKTHPSVRRVVVAVDGATRDGTATEALLGGAVVHFDPMIRGKGQCVMHALEYVETDRVIFCDADISGINTEDIDFLVKDVSKQLIVVPKIPDDLEWKSSGFVIGQAKKAYPWVSGIRSVDTWIVRRLNLHGYLMEVQLNNAYFKHHIFTHFHHSKTLTSPLRITPQRLEEMERDRRWGLEKGVFMNQNYSYE